jgi:hypothetical protein
VPEANDELPAGLSPYQSSLRLRRWIINANSYANRRKARFRLFSSVTKMLTLSLSGASTIILGLQDLDFWAGLGFALVALTTVVNAIEPFFNWRSRWVLAEEAQHDFYRLQEDLEHLVGSIPAEDLRDQDITHLYDRYRQVWNDFSAKWLEQRRTADKSAGHS